VHTSTGFIMSHELRDAIAQELRNTIAPTSNRRTQATAAGTSQPRARAVLTGAPYGGLVEVFDAFHLPRTTAFRYAKEGLVETFLIGRKRMVTVKSVETLPERLRSIKERGNEG
jgi:hypothetical protein